MSPVFVVVLVNTISWPFLIRCGTGGGSGRGGVLGAVYRAGGPGSFEYGPMMQVRATTIAAAAADAPSLLCCYWTRRQL